jgi:excisionase family DNA binding protein
VSLLISEERTEYLMGVEEVATFLGLGRTYTYKLLASGAIPSVRIGRLKKVRRSAVEEFVDAHTKRGEYGAA